MRAAASLFAVLLVGQALGQGDPATISRIIAEGKERSQVVTLLRHLTKNIGPRLTGSPRYQAAAEWCAKKFREFGLKNVQLESAVTVPIPWDRTGPQSARMIEPYERKLVFTTMAWSPSTRGVATGPAVAEPTDMDSFNRVKDSLRGAWVISAAPVTMRGPQPGDKDAALQKAISEAGILGRVYSSSSELVNTYGYMPASPDQLPTEIRVIVRKSDMAAIRQALIAERPTRLAIQAGATFYPGPAQVPNVIAEIPGSEKPDEVVLFGAHLDSWNGPGSEGANDDGTGSMVMLEAARILAKAGAKPKRTIRFVLFAGEEQGLLGSRAYAEKYASSMGKISAVFVDDGGSNYQGGLAGSSDMKEMLELALAPMSRAFPDMPVSVTVSDPFPSFGGSDHFSFLAYGVPGFFFKETGRHNYGFVWHSQNDTFENTIPEYLVQSATNSAVVGFNLASADKLLPRLPKSGG